MLTTIQSTKMNFLPSLDFTLPPELEAPNPPEARGLARDEVRLMVSNYENDSIAHTTFRQIGDFLEAGDVVVINTSATLPAAVEGIYAGDFPVHVHFSTQLSATHHVVELRQPTETGTKPFSSAAPATTVQLSGGVSLQLLTPYGKQTHHLGGKVRLWVAQLDGVNDLHSYLHEHGFPIRYGYVEQAWSLEHYQTVYANQWGSAEMPSAGRAFSAELITQLIAKGVQFAPLILHTGVASLEDHEPPYAEWYHVPRATAQLVNLARQSGRRIIAIGTTAVRALETVTDENGWVHAGEGWTELIIGEGIRSLHVVNGLLTGFHEPQATHLAMLQALAGSDHLRLTYSAALDHRYLWHEFGDLHLLLP